jgi:hypothetical protein
MLAGASDGPCEVTTFACRAKSAPDGIVEA